MIDLNSRSGLSDRLNWLIDEGIDASVETPRTYLGCSAIGGECERSVQLEYAAYAGNRDAGREARCTHRPVPSRLVSAEYSKEDMMLRIVPLDGCSPPACCL